jgi:hypothetical protein
MTLLITLKISPADAGFGNHALSKALLPSSAAKGIDYYK